MEIIHGVPMEFHGMPWSSMEYPWSSMEWNGVPWSIHVVPWTAMEFLGVPWNSDGVPWTAMKFHGVSLEVHGIPGNIVEFHGMPWGSLKYQCSFMECDSVSMEFDIIPCSLYEKIHRNSVIKQLINLLTQGSQILQIWRILRQNCSDDSTEVTEGVTLTPEIFGNKQGATSTAEIFG